MEATFIGLMDVLEDRPQTQPIHSLTTIVDSTLETEFEKVVVRLISPVMIFDSRRFKVIPGANALWDTGAASTCISKAAAQKLDLHEVGRKTCIMPIGQIETPVYRINLVMWEDMEFNDIEVTEYPLENHDCDILIGMDIISKGKLVINNDKGKTKLYFTV